MLDRKTQAGQVNTRQASITGFPIDNVGPNVSVSFTKADTSVYTPGTWSTQDIIQSLSGTDPGGSGISYYQYSENSGTPVNTSSGGSWSAERNSKVKFRGVDTLGNVGEWTTEYQIMIDKTPPTYSVSMKDIIGSNQSRTWLLHVRYNGKSQ